MDEDWKPPLHQCTCCDDDIKSDITASRDMLTEIVDGWPVTPLRLAGAIIVVEKELLKVKKHLFSHYMKID